MMNRREDRDEELFDRYLSDSLSREDAETLKVLLREDTEAQRSFFEHVKQTGLTIFAATKYAAAAGEPKEAPSGPPPRMILLRRLATWGAVAAAVVLAAGVSFYYGTLTPALPAAEMTAELGTFTPPLRILRDTDEVPPEAGMRLEDHDVLHVGEGGSATIVYPSEGSTVRLETRTYATLWDESDTRYVDLIQGSLEYRSAGTSKHRSAVITTPSTTATAIGTRFIILVEGERTRLQVREGAVRFESKDTKQAVRVAAGQSAIGAEGVPIEVEAVPENVLAAWRSEQVLSEGLVGYWPFDEGGGAKAYDYSGHGNHGTIYRATWEDGKINGALNIHGGWYVDAGEASSLKIADHVTMAAWIKIGMPVSSKGPRRIIGQDHEGVRNYHLYVDGNGQGQWRLHLSNSRRDDTHPAGGVSPYVLRRDVWYHVAGVITTKDGGSHRYYVNGELVAEHRGYGFDRLRTDAGRTHIGTPEGAFYGLVDDVRIYNRALSDGEVARLAAWRPEEHVED